jgi:hypothetical protein
MPSEVYARVRQAVRERKQIIFSYKGGTRESCPLVLGYAADGQEKLFAYQFGGVTSPGSKLPDWRCYFVARIKNLQLRDGPWLEGTSHKQAQSCVRWVDVDANIPETLMGSASLPFGSSELRAPRTTP